LVDFYHNLPKDSPGLSLPPIENSILQGVFEDYLLHEHISGFRNIKGSRILTCREFFSLYNQPKPILYITVNNRGPLMYLKQAECYSYRYRYEPARGGGEHRLFYTVPQKSFVLFTIAILLILISLFGLSYTRFFAAPSEPGTKESTISLDGRDFSLDGSQNFSGPPLPESGPPSEDGIQEPEPFQENATLDDYLQKGAPESQLPIGESARLGKIKSLLESSLGIQVLSLQREGEKHSLEFAIGSSRILLKGMNPEDFQSAKLLRIPSASIRSKPVPLGTPTIFLNPLSIESAQITLQKSGPVNAILKCTEFSQEAQDCISWETTKIPFTDSGSEITFSVQGFSGYAGAYINILNIQSYPTVGGNWTVSFNTTGSAPLYIRASYGTTWSDSQDTEDLRLLEILCGPNPLSYVWIPETSTAYIADFSCSETAYETSRVLTGGPHTLEFTFGDQTEHAQNFATFNCTDCTSCSQYIQNGSMSSGDVLYLTQSITDHADSSCIIFGGMDNITFDCLGNTIDGTRAGFWEGMYLDNSVNNTIRNCTVKDFYYGVSLTSTSFNTTILYLNTSHNTGRGAIISSSNNTLYEVTSNSNSLQGIYLDSSSYNNLTNVNASYNSNTGVYMYSASRNNLTNITAIKNSQYGIQVYLNSDYNNITLSRLLSNTNGGIYLDEDTSTDPEYNLIWNNYLNNTVNILIDSGIANPNYFNTTLNCSAGPNIIGGPCIGGNYWTDPDGNYSDTCTDGDNDGICDTLYNLSATYSWASDYLPLAEDPPTEAQPPIPGYSSTCRQMRPSPGARLTGITGHGKT
jgi:parallel beta-helix repeat protein